MSNDTQKPSDEEPKPQVEEGSPAESPAPEPWTPERVVEWNNYYNIYVAIGLLVLVVVKTLNLFEESAIWASLRSGEITLSRGFPETTDTLSYTAQGSRWVNLGWLFDTISAATFKIGRSFASAETADQYGAGAVTILHAIIRLLTFLVLLSIGKTKQGLWGRSVLLGLAVLIGLGDGIVSPDLWGILFLSLLLRSMFLFTDRGRAWAMWAIPTILALWVNFDSSAGFGLILTIGWGIGLILGSKKLENPVQPKKVAILLAASVAACLVNPWLFHAFGAMFRTSNQYSLIPGGFMGSVSLPADLRNAFVLRLASFVVIAIATFWLNIDRLRLDRALMLAASAFCFVVWMRYNGELTLVLAVIVGLNLEEWFVDAFGTEGRMDAKWRLFSLGGRGITILALFGLAAQHITGYGLQEGASTFGLGFNADRYAFEAATFLKDAKFSGQVFNWNSSQGNMLLWSSYPSRKTFLDDRRNLFNDQIRADREKLRGALRDDNAAIWRPLLDQYGISAVMVQAMSTSFSEAAAPQTLERLSQSPNWIPFYDDGVVAIFGRADAKGEDLAYFNQFRRDADRIVYKTKDTVPAFDRPPTPASVLDQVIATKALGTVQPHAQAAVRWLYPPGKQASTGPVFAEPSQCIAAIREARRAIAKKPDQTQPYRVLADAYRMLHTQELGLLSGLKLEPANFAQIATLQAGPSPLGLRYRQRVAAVNFALQTSPPPVSQSEKETLALLHSEMAQLLLLANCVDMARDHLRTALELDPEAANAAEKRAQLAQINQAVEQMEADMNSLSLEQQANAGIRINRALSIGLVNQALADLRESEATGTSPDTILPVLIDLYCQLGMPDQAIPLIGNSGGNKSLETSAGLSPYRQGLVSSLLGDYSGGVVLWGNESIPVASLDEMRRGLMAGQMWLVGELGTATRSFIELPDQGRIVADRQFELGLIQLESGMPEAAADSFTKTLKRDPESVLSPIARYYLEKLGKPFPEVKKPETAAAPSVPAAAPAAAPAAKPVAQPPK